MLEYILDRWYQRSRGRWTRLAVAATAGAIVAMVSGFLREPEFARQRWPLLGIAGAALGWLGGWLLMLEERRIAAGIDPAWRRIARRVIWALAILAFAALLPVFIYTMWRVVQGT